MTGRAVFVRNMTEAERKRLQREQAVKSGLCNICCSRKARKGLKSCEECYERSKKALYARRDKAKAKPKRKKR